MLGVGASSLLPCYLRKKEGFSHPTELTARGGAGRGAHAPSVLFNPLPPSRESRLRCTCLLEEHGAPRAREAGPALWLPWKPLNVNFIFCLAQLSYRFSKRERNWEQFPSPSEAEGSVVRCSETSQRRGWSGVSCARLPRGKGRAPCRFSAPANLLTQVRWSDPSSGPPAV